ncbi:MAG: phage tail sheath family protein [Desulfobacterales bacterium]|nr:phage tail sheath family protein [Desulfobacterales bacterium]
MPITPTYPGVYIEEIPSGVRTIVGVATSITAFIGRALRGPVDKAIRIQSYADFHRTFGGLWCDSTMSYSVQHYFLHGGTDAIIVRVANGAVSAEIELACDNGEVLTLKAIGPGEWGNALRASVSHEATKDPKNENKEDLFTLTVQELETPGSKNVVGSETFINLSCDPANRRFVKTVIDEESRLVNVKGAVKRDRPVATITNADDPANAAKYTAADGAGAVGVAITDAQITHPNLKATRQGLYALEDVDLFNMLCIPPLERDADGDVSIGRAAKYCKDRRAVLILDSPSSWRDTALAKAGVDAVRTLVGSKRAENVAIYYPRLKMPDPLQENRPMVFAPGGAVAGVIARTDAQRGVWKAPAGTEASFSGVREFTYKLTDGENGQLNPLGLNCLRNFRVYGNVIWGARTLAGADQLASEWKYLPVRRTALFIEESLFRGSQWVVFEPNDEPLWAQIRLNVGAFMHNLFRQGAFQGTKPKDAYLVKCDKDTTTQNDINLGIVNILVGFAPLKPAEFVIIKIQQLAGQIET